MTYESPSAYEQRTIPESIGDMPIVSSKKWCWNQERRQWLSEMRKQEDELMKDPAWRKTNEENERLLNQNRYYND